MTKLPYEFDLLYDIKTIDDIEAIAQNKPHNFDASIEDLLKLFLKHNFDIPYYLTPKIKIEEFNLYYIYNETQFNNLIKNIAFNFNDFFCKVIENNIKDSGIFEGEGIYNIIYNVENPCKHGFEINKIHKEQIKAIINKLLKML